MPKTAAIHVPAELRRDLDRVCKALGKNPDAFAADAVRRRIALVELDRISQLARREMKRRYGRVLTEEEVFRILS